MGGGAVRGCRGRGSHRTSCGRRGAGIFRAAALAKGDLKVLFTSKTGMPFDEELIVINAKPAFLKQHPAAVNAFLSDLADVTKYLMENQKRPARHCSMPSSLPCRRTST